MEPFGILFIITTILYLRVRPFLFRTTNTFTLSDLNYRFLIGSNLGIIVGARGVNAVNVFRGPNRVESAGSGPISLFAQRNPVISLNAGQAGLGFDWKIAKEVSLQGVYSAGNAASASGDGGLFGGPTSIGLQLAANVFERIDVALYYLNSYTNNGTLNPHSARNGMVK